MPDITYAFTPWGRVYVFFFFFFMYAMVFSDYSNGLTTTVISFGDGGFLPQKINPDAGDNEPITNGGWMILFAGTFLYVCSIWGES